VGHYRSNLRDIEFTLFEVLGRDQVLGTGPWHDMDVDTARSALRQVDRLAREELAASFAAGDRTPPVYDAAARTVAMPEAFRRSYEALRDAQWWRLHVPVELGGHPAPPSLRWAIAELTLGSNPAVHMYSSGPGTASVIWRNGTPELQRFALTMVERGWASTMVLTEPDAGSDVGAGRTRALPQPDGSWHLEGVKRFITSGEHDLEENIVHLVLARVAGVEGAGGPGTKGLSLFVVPKFRVDLATGELGERNGVYATNVESKMGLKVSTTCELTFGHDAPAVGWLLGGLDDGIAQMFEVIEYARMMVGTKAIAALSTGYLNALEYAKHRVQGADLLSMIDKTAPRVPITHHPDVRRSLLTQKSYAEGMRALVLFTASIQDAVALAAETRDEQGEHDDLMARVNDLLLPVVKGYGSERSYQLLGSECLQTLGGSGYLQDYPIEQYVRDAKIDTLYEGTTAIQGLDFFFRKIVRDQGTALTWLAGQVQATLDGDGAGDDRLKVDRDLLAGALADVQAMIGAMFGFLLSASPQAEGGDPRNLYKVAANTTRLLLAVGDLVTGWLLLRQAEVALRQLAGAVPAKDAAFYEGKVAAAQFFARQVLPRLSAERAVLEATDLSVMDLPVEAF
jgi:alkylation response protein AidB-like acyl-CoA dehydrogenase